MHRAVTIHLMTAVLATGPLGPLSAPLRELLDARPADSLVAPLKKFELEHAQAPEGGEAAFVLGQFHFARGEYRQACDAFGRAASRLESERRPLARYWTGLSWLALKQPDPARAAFEEAAQANAGLRAQALLGVALAEELADKPEAALQALESVLQRSPGEAGPAALERQIALAERLQRPELARKATARLRRDYPRSIEAARVSLPAAAPPPAPAADGSVTVQIGAFADPARAKSLVESAQRRGFPSATVIVRGEGDARMHVVTLGVFGTREEARRAGERAAAELGVTYQVTRFP
jgi:tetratricopeptide (TPR) repeat protein